MTEESGACDGSDFDGNTILVGDNGNETIFISGFEIIKFSAEEKIIDLKSLMGNNMISIAIAAGENYTFF